MSPVHSVQANCFMNVLPCFLSSYPSLEERGIPFQVIWMSVHNHIFFLIVHVFKMTMALEVSKMAGCFPGNSSKIQNLWFLAS